MRLLIADKDPYGLEAMVSALRAPDLEILTAVDGREILRMAAEHRPDVVVAAASLGQMGGFAVSRDLKMQSDAPGAPPAPRVVVLLEREADAWLADWSRCDAWWTKPVGDEELHRLVSEGVEGAVSRGSSASGTRGRRRRPR